MVRNGSNTADRPAADAATIIVVRNLSPADFTMAFQLACTRAANMTTAKTLNGMRVRKSASGWTPNSQPARIAVATGNRAALIDGRMPPSSAMESDQHSAIMIRCGVTAIGKGDSRGHHDVLVEEVPVDGSAEQRRGDREYQPLRKH